MSNKYFTNNISNNNRTLQTFTVIEHIHCDVSISDERGKKFFKTSKSQEASFLPHTFLTSYLNKIFLPQFFTSS